MERQRSIIISFVLLFTIVILSFLTVNSFEQTTAEKELVTDPVGETYYLIHYDPNGGAGGSETDFGYVASGAQYTLETWDYSRPGYTLIGWNTELDGSGASYSLVYHFDSYDLGKDLILYAVWQLKSFTIKYDSNGGSGTIENIVVNYGAELIIDDGSNFSKKGYHIDCWNAIYDDGVRTSVYGLSQAIQNYTYQEGMTLYAVWEENSYTVTYKGNDGVGEDITEFLYYGEKYVLKDNLAFLRDGYTLSGWSTQSNGSGETFELLEEFSSYGYTSNLTLYAIWVPNTYHVLFNYHEATDNASDSGKTVTYDALYGTLPSPMKSD
ncbi:MAG: InlB B-repeat-containing protein, partial [Candidatus Methanomethylophilaceae archaeon]